MPFHPDLRPNKADSFIKKFLKRKGANFNTAIGSHQPNLADCILDPLALLSHLWLSVISAQSGGTDVDPKLVIEASSRAMSLMGNDSHGALVDRRKGLLAKISSECLDLINDPESFVPGSSELFGKSSKRPFSKI
jgi:hypothetical protein